MANNTLSLASNASAGAGTAAVWHGGPGTLFFEGTISGATITFEAQTPNSTWIVVNTITANGATNFDLPKGISVRLNVVGGTAPAGIYASVIPRSSVKGE